MAQLTKGGVQQMIQNGPAPFRLQIIGCKAMENPKTATRRYRLLVSDGEQAVAVMMASQFTHLIDSSNSDIRELTVIDVVEYVNNVVNDKNVIILLNIAIVQQDVPKIGEPVVVNSKQAQPQHAPPMQNQGMPAYGAPAPHSNTMNEMGPQYGAPMGTIQRNPLQQHPVQNQAPAPSHMPPPQYGNQNMVASNGYMGAQNTKPYGMNAGPNPHMPAAGGYGGQITSPPKPQYSGAPGSAVLRNQAPVNFVPIASLNAYQNRWTIKARVTQKSDIRRYTNARGEGKFFSFDLLDADKGEIRVVGWNDQCDRFYDQVEEGRVYMISRASLRTKRGNFNQTKHPFEIHLETSTLIEPVSDEDAIPKISFSFVPLSQIEDMPQGNMVDICTVVENVAEITEITRKDGTQVRKRAANIRDASGRSIELTLWDKYSVNPGDKLAAAIGNGHHPVIAIKNTRIGDFNGKTLSTVGSTQIVVDPHDIPEATHLRNWFDQGGASIIPQALSAKSGLGTSKVDRRISISQIKGEQLGLASDGKADWVQVLGQIIFIKSDAYAYPACPLQYNGRPCNKKLIDQTGAGDQWFCERCNQSVPGPDFRYIISAQISDHTDMHWITAFNEVGQDLMGMPAEQLKQWEQTDDPNFSSSFQNIYGKEVTAKLKISEDNYQDERRLRVTLMRVDPVDFVAETKRTLEALRKVEQGEHPFPPVQKNIQEQPQQQQTGGYNVGTGTSWGPPQGAMAGMYAGNTMNAPGIAHPGAYGSLNGFGGAPTGMQANYQSAMQGGYINQGGQLW